jgi:hypothetical protein
LNLTSPGLTIPALTIPPFSIDVPDPAPPVVAAQAPTIPTTAHSWRWLEQVTTWQATHDAATPGTAQGSSAFDTTKVARNFNFTYTQNAGMRYSLVVAVESTLENHCYDLMVQFDDPTQILNMELDLNQVLTDGRTCIMDCQCASHSGTWEYHNWKPSNIKGNPQTWGTGWHHIRIFWHRSADGNLTYWDGVEFDGVYTAFTVPPALTSKALGWGAGRNVMNFQIEGAKGSGSVSANAKNITMWSW